MVTDPVALDQQNHYGALHISDADYKIAYIITEEDTKIGSAFETT